MSTGFSELLLLGPGPSNPYPEATAALARPVLGHLDPEFLDLYGEVGDRLRAVFQTANRVTLPVSGTGSSGMEACLVSLLDPGDVAVVGVNGYFGERLCEVARRIGADVVRVEGEWGRPLDPERLLEAQRTAAGGRARLLAVVHAETSTGVRNEVAPLRSLQETDTLFVLDTVTSLGGIPVEVDAWGVDAAYSATQKCLGAVSGLAPITFSDRAMARVAARSGDGGRPPGSFYLDVGLLDAYVHEPHRYHHTASSVLVSALHAGLGRLLDEGLPAVWERHRRIGELLQAALPALGFELVAPDGHRLPQLTTARLPAGLDDAATRRTLRDEFGIEVGGGLGPFAGAAWRIGLMGHGARERSVAALLGALQWLLPPA
ncbi:MAG TPA: alanine--glyoxylate aminotransferase family protein [Acidimicrobiia bacterium]|nr:alanine--glyoxylate aminotransferase family protein [Acidimicrobiia bacterium]